MTKREYESVGCDSLNCEKNENGKCALLQMKVLDGGDNSDLVVKGFPGPFTEEMLYDEQQENGAIKRANYRQKMGVCGIFLAGMGIFSVALGAIGHKYGMQGNGLTQLGKNAELIIAGAVSTIIGSLFLYLGRRHFKGSEDEIREIANHLLKKCPNNPDNKKRR